MQWIFIRNARISVSEYLLKITVGQCSLNVSRSQWSVCIFNCICFVLAICYICTCFELLYDDLITWKRFLHYWSFAEIWCFLWCQPEQAVEQTGELPGIWDTLTLMWRHSNVYSLQWRRMTLMASQITGDSTVCSVLHQRKHQSTVLLALCEGKPPGTSGFPSLRDNNTESVSMWWRHHVSVLRTRSGVPWAGPSSSCSSRWFSTSSWPSTSVRWTPVKVTMMCKYWFVNCC